MTNNLYQLSYACLYENATAVLLPGNDRNEFGRCGKQNDSTILLKGDPYPIGTVI